MPRSRKSAKPSEPRWLTARQLDVWQALMGTIIRLPAALDAQLQRDSQLSLLEYYVLARISEDPQHTVRLSQLAMLTNAELSRISHLISRLVRRGLVRREPDPCDGRFTNAVLTDDGYAHLVAAAPGHVARVRELVIDAMDRCELAALQASCERVIERIRESDAAGDSRPAG